MTQEKGLAPEAADKIGQYVQKKGGRDLLAELKDIPELTANPSFAEGLADMELLIGYLETFQVMPVLSFDLSLARGLDYYTGVIYEVVTEASAPPARSADDSKKKGKKEKQRAPGDDADDPDADRSNDDSIGVGSIAAGGRYDELVGMFSANAAKGRIPCVGISFGVDRIFSITKARMTEPVRGNEVDVYVMAFGGKGFNGLVKERMDVCKTLWDAGIKVPLPRRPRMCV